jgi:Ca-activated chloride channel family protein
MPAKLQLSTTWNRDPLPATDQASLAYLVVDIVKEASSEDSSGAGLQNPVNLSLVLDTSGSMAGAKLQNLKQAVRWVIEHLNPEDRIAVTLFDDEVHPLAPSTRVADAGGLLGQVEAIREAGGTAMSKGLLVGLDEARKGASTQYEDAHTGVVSRIIVLTDGQTWGDAAQCKELAKEAGAAGIPISALGVGAEEDWSIELLDALASESGGIAGYIARPEDISTAFEETVLAMQQAAARNVRLSLEPSRGVSIRGVYRAAPMISRLWPAPGVADQAQSEAEQPALTLPLGDIQSDGGQTLLYEVLLPPRRPGQYKLARISLMYEASGHAQSETALDLAAAFTPGGQPGPGNPRVMNIVEKATTFKLQTRALEASMLGDVANATRNLRAAATRLLNMGETQLAEATEQEAQALESAGRMTPAGTKKLAFDTRKLA